MPHVAIKVRAGESEHHKQALTDAVVRAVIEHLGSTDDEVSVTIEDVLPEDWKDRIYEPEIVGGPGILYKAPGYRL